MERGTEVSVDISAMIATDPMKKRGALDFQLRIYYMASRRAQHRPTNWVNARKLRGKGIHLIERSIDSTYSACPWGQRLGGGGRLEGLQ